MVHDDLPDIRRFSNWNRLIRATAYVKKFIDACRTKKKRRKFTLTIADLQEAEMRWLYASQRDCFALEKQLLSSNRQVQKSSRIFSLSPYMDDDGLLRILGRIDRAEAPFEVKRPIILDPKHPY